MTASIHPFPKVTVDVVVFGLDIDPGEALEEAARRELWEETHAEPSYLDQLATFGDPGRDPHGHVISVTYLALVRCDSLTIQGGG